MAANVAAFSVIRDGTFAVDVNGLDSERFNFHFRGGLLKDLEGIEAKSTGSQFQQISEAIRPVQCGGPRAPAFSRNACFIRRLSRG
jgi:hypothetical protein